MVGGIHDDWPVHPVPEQRLLLVAVRPVSIHADYCLPIFYQHTQLPLTCNNAAGLTVPGQKYTFDVVKAAQARGDFYVLTERSRWALRIHLGKDIQAGLVVLQALT
jgi:hypothetical protein